MTGPGQPSVKPLFLHHIMKTGGRALSASVRQAFLDLVGITCLDGCGFHGLVHGGGIPDLVIGPWIVTGPHQNFPFQTTHYPMRMVPAPPGFLRAAILRDPLERVVSLFRMYATEHPNHPWWGQYENSGLPPPEPEWRAFVEGAPDHTINQMTSMFSESLDPSEAA